MSVHMPANSHQWLSDILHIKHLMFSPFTANLVKVSDNPEHTSDNVFLCDVSTKLGFCWPYVQVNLSGARGLPMYGAGSCDPIWILFMPNNCQNNLKPLTVISRDESSLVFDKGLNGFLCESLFSYPRTHQQLQFSRFPHRMKQNVMTPILVM